MLAGGPRGDPHDDRARHLGDPDASAATTRAAEYFRVDPASVLLTNGLDEGLLIAALLAGFW